MKLCILYFNELMDFPYETNSTTATTELIDPINQVAVGAQDSNDSFIEQILEVFGFNVGKASWWAQVDSIFTYIQAIFNFALWLLAFISVCIIIYNFFMIFFDKEKEGVENAKKAVKRVAYVLLIIGFSWIIVSFLFWIMWIII